MRISIEDTRDLFDKDPNCLVKVSLSHLDIFIETGKIEFSQVRDFGDFGE